MEQSYFAVVFAFGMLNMYAHIYSETTIDEIPRGQKISGIMILTLGFLEVTRWAIGVGDFHLALGLPAVILGAWLSLAESWGDTP